MTTDRELLEWAAKAHGGLEYVYGCDAWIHVDEHGERGAWWNPLVDDGDALRLAVKLRLELDISADPVCAGDGVSVGVRELYGEEPCAATRRAIVRSAAEIGRTM